MPIALGAGLDVFEVEPPTNLMLTGHPRVTCCPHLGANTLEAQQRCGQEIGKQIVSLTQGTSTEGIVRICDDLRYLSLCNICLLDQLSCPYQFNSIRN